MIVELWLNACGLVNQLLYIYDARHMPVLWPFSHLFNVGTLKSGRLPVLSHVCVKEIEETLDEWLHVL